MLDCSAKLSYSLLLISYIIIFVMIIVILVKGKITEKGYFEMIYYTSKIMTIKNIVLTNHNSEIFNSFSSTGEPSGLSLNYKNLLKLLKQNGECPENYKPCGILDTLGNLLCIDEYFDCPINKYKVDLTSRKNNYLENNYHTAILKNMSYNYNFFYSNEFTDGQAGVIIIKTEDEPQYLTTNNFLIDYETYKDYFGDLDFIEDLSKIFGGDDNSNASEEDKNIDRVIKIAEIIASDSDIEMDLIKIGAKGLFALITNEYNKKFERFKEYIEEKIKEGEDENIDIYYNHIGDDFYVKNYIGFKNVKDIKKFLEFDYDIIKNVFPNKATTIVACVYFSFIFILLLLIIYLWAIKKSECLTDIAFRFFDIPFFYSITLTIFIEALVAFLKVNKNKNLEELKLIKSDEFINNFFFFFASKCQENAFVLSSIAITALSFC